MSNLRRSILLAALYLVAIFLLGESDYVGRQIINFASYFYLVVMIAMPVTLLLPLVSRLPVFVPLIFWASVYMAVAQLVDRSISADNSLAILLLEFGLLEVGVWIFWQLAVQLENAESLMDSLALSAYPNRTLDIDAAVPQIRVELTRSRRYHRPLSLIVLQPDPEEFHSIQEMMHSIQQDLLKRFSFARIGQVVDEQLRQTDLLMRDRVGRLIILCPETDVESSTMLARRIAQEVENKTGVRMLWGTSAFPDEALTFDDLLQKARERLAHVSVEAVEQQPAMVETNGR
jgi:GGDEF domain-containing protein